MRTKQWIVGSVIAVSVILAIGIAVKPWQSSSPPAKVRMGYLPMISSLTYFVAIEKGYFDDSGVVVEGIPIGTSDNIAKTLTNGDIEIAVELSVVPLLKAFEEQRRSNGRDSRPSFLVFSHSLINEGNGFDSVIVKRDSPIKDWRDLSGKTIGAFPGTTAEKTIRDVFKRDFGDIAAPKVVVKVPNLHIAALLNNEFEALHTYEPFLTQGIVEHGFRVVRTSLYAAQMPSDTKGKPKESPIGVAAANREWVEKNSETAAKAIAALDRAADYISKYPEDAKRIAAKYTKMREGLASVMNVMPMTASKDLNTELLSDYIKILKDITELGETVDANKIIYKKEK